MSKKIISTKSEITHKSCTGDSEYLEAYNGTKLSQADTARFSAIMNKSLHLEDLYCGT